MVAATWSGNSSCTANFAWGTIVATTLGKPAKASISVRDLGGVLGPVHDHDWIIDLLRCNEERLSCRHRIKFSGNKADR